MKTFTTLSTRKFALPAVGFLLLGAVGGSLVTRQVLFNDWGGPGDHIATEWRNLLSLAADGQGNLRSDDETTKRILGAVHAYSFGVARLYESASPERGQRFARDVAKLIEDNPALQAHAAEWTRAATMRRCILNHAETPSMVVECSIEALGELESPATARLGMVD